MRDNHEGLPELVDAYERQGRYFGVAQVLLGAERTAFEFGIDQASYEALRRVLQMRPYGSSESGSCRYYFAPSAGRIAEGSDAVEFAVRVEQGRAGRQFKVVGPATLVANLLWFLELKSPDAASHLRRVPSRPEV
jgi:hypothetical protein